MPFFISTHVAFRLCYLFLSILSIYLIYLSYLSLCVCLHAVSHISMLTVPRPLLRQHKHLSALRDAQAKGRQLNSAEQQFLTAEGEHVQQQPRLSAKTAVSVLISSSYLQMADLEDTCLA